VLLGKRNRTNITRDMPTIEWRVRSCPNRGYFPLVNEPREPLPPSVYRRRRVVAMAGLGVGAVLFVWAVGALLGGGDSPAVQGVANVRPAGVPLLTSSAPSSNPPVSGPLAASDPSSSASASTFASATAPSVTGTPTTTTGRPTPTTTTTTTPPAPTACPDSVIRLTMTEDKASYHVGDQPLLTLHVGNTGPVACIRDVSHQLRSIQVLPASGSKPVWASEDCYTLHTNDLDTLQPGQSLAFSVQWAGRTAAPGCPADRSMVPAGSYRVIGKLGKLTSPAAPLLLATT
jgi:hypothetical protein